MGKITFRADEDLLEELEAVDASKSAVMRAALREYLESHVDGGHRKTTARPGAFGREMSSIDDLVASRVDELVERRLAELPDVTVSVSLDGERKTPGNRVDGRAATAEDVGGDSGDRECKQCGEWVDDDHVYCPNCGEKTANRLFCECGDEIRSDWAFCPGCGRRTPAADVLDSG